MKADLLLAESALQALLEHCRREHPREACGWLAGAIDVAERDGEVFPRWGRAWRAYPMGNVATDPRRRYEMEPEEQFAVMRRMRAVGEQLVAIYHSHPETPARPSEIDLALAYTKDAFYVIVSLAASEPDVRAWRLNADTGRSEEAVLRVVPDESLRGFEHGLRGANGSADA